MKWNGLKGIKTVEMKWGERREIKWNESNWNEMKRNEEKWNEKKWNGVEWREMK